MASYTYEHETAGLTALVIFRGSTRQASRSLKDQGLTIPESTLRAWAKRYPERMAEIRQGKAQEISERWVAKLEGDAATAQDVAMRLVEKAKREISNMTGKEAADAAYKITMAFKTLDERHRLATDKPTEIVQVNNGEDFLRDLATKVPSLFVDSTGEEIKPKQLNG